MAGEVITVQLSEKQRSIPHASLRRQLGPGMINAHFDTLLRPRYLADAKLTPKSREYRDCQREHVFHQFSATPRLRANEPSYRIGKRRAQK